MIELNHILFGACLFITSYSLLLTRKLTGKYMKKMDILHDSNGSNNIMMSSPLRNDSKAASDIVDVAINGTIVDLKDTSSPTASVNSETSLSTAMNSSNNNNNATGLDTVDTNTHQTDRTTTTVSNNDTHNSTIACSSDAIDTHMIARHDSNIQAELYRNTTSLIDLMLPYMENEILTNLINDELVSSVIVGGSCKSFYVCIHTDKAFNCPKSVIINYISILYSKIWNEALLKENLDLQCYIICDDFEDLVSREEVLQKPHLTHLYSLLSNQTHINRHDLGQEDVTIINIYDSPSIKQLLIDYRSQAKVLVLDSFYEEQEADYPIYTKLSLGGTFDHLHYGHRKLLTLALLCCQRELVIGITSSSMLSKKSHQSIIHSFIERKRSVEYFIRSLKPTLKTVLIELNDPFGPTITDPDIDAILVSSETIKAAFKINQIRRDKGFKLLDILVTYRTDSVILSSSFIREKISSKFNK